MSSRAPSFLLSEKNTNSTASPENMQANQGPACLSPGGECYYITVSEWCFMAVFWLSHASAKICNSAGFCPLFERAVQHASSFSEKSCVLVAVSNEEEREGHSGIEMYFTVVIYTRIHTPPLKKEFHEVWLADGTREKLVSNLDFMSCSCVLEIFASSGSSWISQYLLLLLSGKCLTMF